MIQVNWRRAAASCAAFLDSLGQAVYFRPNSGSRYASGPMAYAGIAPCQRVAPTGASLV